MTSQLSTSASEKNVTILDLLDRILEKGMLLGGDATISVAGVDLIYLGVRVLLSSVQTLEDKEMQVGYQPSRRFDYESQPADAPVAEIGEPLAAAETPPLEAGLAESPSREAERAADIVPPRVDVDPERVEQGLAKLVLTLIELVRRLLERQAARRVESGSLTEAEIDRLGTTLHKLENRMDELKDAFGLTGEELNLDLGPLGDLM